MKELYKKIVMDNAGKYSGCGTNIAVNVHHDYLRDYGLPIEDVVAIVNSGVDHPARIRYSNYTQTFVKKVTIDSVVNMNPAKQKALIDEQITNQLVNLGKDLEHAINRNDPEGNPDEPNRAMKGISGFAVNPNYSKVKICFLIEPTVTYKDNTATVLMEATYEYHG